MNQAIVSKCLYFFLLPILFSCHQKNKIKLTGLTERQIKLDSGLGIITINLPARLNRYNRWLNKDIERTTYCFYDSDYPLRKENSNEDSMCQFDLWQTSSSAKEVQTHSCFSKIDSLEILGKQPQITDGSIYYLLREFITINNKRFAILLGKAQGFRSARLTFFVVATTCMSNKRLQFVARYRGEDTTGFYNEMYNSMLSIRMNEN